MESQGPGARTAATNESIAGTALLEYGSAAGTQSFTLIDWIVEINKVWARDAASTLDMARVVSAAKGHLRQQYGKWSQLWKSGQEMPISKSTADQLAVIGQQMGGLDSQTSENLPRGWNTLYCLARLDRGTLEQLVQQEAVHPKLTLRQARSLVARLRGTRTHARTRKASVREWLRRSAEYVSTHSPDWSEDVRELATEGLTQLIEQIATRSGSTYDPNPCSRVPDPCLVGQLTEQTVKHADLSILSRSHQKSI